MFGREGSLREKYESSEEVVSSRIFLPSGDVPRRVGGLGLERLPLQTNTPTTTGSPLAPQYREETFSHKYTLVSKMRGVV